MSSTRSAGCTRTTRTGPKCRCSGISTARSHGCLADESHPPDCCHHSHMSDTQQSAQRYLEQICKADDPDDLSKQFAHWHTTMDEIAAAYLSVHPTITPSLVRLTQLFRFVEDLRRSAPVKRCGNG